HSLNDRRGVRSCGLTGWVAGAPAWRRTRRPWSVGDERACRGVSPQKYAPALPHAAQAHPTEAGRHRLTGFPVDDRPGLGPAEVGEGGVAELVEQARRLGRDARGGRIRRRLGHGYLTAGCRFALLLAGGGGCGAVLGSVAVLERAGLC